MRTGSSFSFTSGKFFPEKNYVKFQSVRISDEMKIWHFRRGKPVFLNFILIWPYCFHLDRIAPESARWLLVKNRDAEAIETVQNVIKNNPKLKDVNVEELIRNTKIVEVDNTVNVVSIKLGKTR